MKKTLTVNLNNIVFHIDDDAYEMLQTYLADVSRHLSDDERAEVMKDIEARIAELFTERLQKNKNVVNIADVDDIINILGKPSQYSTDETETEEKGADTGKTGRKKARRFYRDPENAILGGVSAGIAAYFGWDVTWVRIALVLLTLVSGGNLIFAYLLAWVIAPKAITASQRLEMQGEDVTVENIKSEINNVKNYIESDKFKQSASTFGEKLGEIFRAIFKVIFSLLGAILGFAGMIIAGVLVLVLLFLIFEPSVVSGFAPEFVTDFSTVTPDKLVLLIIAILLVVGCPVFMLIHWAIKAISNKRYEFSKTVFWVIFILWFAGLFMLYSAGAQSLIHWNKIDGGRKWSLSWTKSTAPVTDEERYSEPFEGIDVSGNIEIELTQATTKSIRVSAPEDLQSSIKTKVENGILKVYCNERVFLGNDIKVYISTDSIFNLEASGASKINTTNQFSTSRLRLDLSGASQARLNVWVKESFEADLSGAAYADIDGSANTIDVDASGASKIEADQLTTKNAMVESNGASHAKVHATESLDANASGAGHIECQGNPQKIRKSENIGSSITVK